MAEQEGQDAVFSPRISTRRTRQASKSTAVVDLTTSTVRRSTRIRARTSAPVMEDLVPEPEQLAEGAEIKDSSEKLHLETGNVSDLKETKGVESTSVVADVVDVVKEDGAPAETTEIDDSSEEEETVAQNEVEQGVEINVPTEGGGGADEELSDLREEIGRSDEKLSDLQEEEIEGGADRNQDNITQGNDSEQVPVSQHQLDVDTDDRMTREIGDCEQDSDGVFENTILPQRQPATDAKGGMIQEAEEFDDCEDDSSGVFANDSVTQHQLSTDAQEGMTQEIEDCEEDSNGVLEDTILPQHQLAHDAKEDGMIQEAEGFDQQLQEVEDCSAEGLVSSPENLEIASADGDWQSEKEEDEMTLPDSQIVTEELQASPAKSQASAVTEAIESDTSSPEKAAVEGAIVTSESENSESEAAVKNTSSADFAGYGEMVKNLDVDYNHMSMRKLRKIYKEKVIENKVEGGRRLALAEINDDQF